MNDTSQRFERAFQRIESQLAKTVGSNQHLPFYKLIDNAVETNPVVRRWERSLRKFANLQNLLVHENRELAIPSPQAIQQIEALADSLESPPKLYSLFAMDVKQCSPKESVGRAARIMHDFKFSQLPVVDESGIIDLLTTETIARWLATRLDNDGILESEPIEAVLTHRERDSTYKVLSREATVFDALDLFDEALHAGNDLDAILLTNNGTKKQSPLGILTAFDIPRMLREAQLRT